MQLSDIIGRDRDGTGVPFAVCISNKGTTSADDRLGAIGFRNIPAFDQVGAFAGAGKCDLLLVAVRFIVRHIIKFITLQRLAVDGVAEVADGRICVHFNTTQSTGDIPTINIFLRTLQKNAVYAFIGAGSVADNVSKSPA